MKGFADGFTTTISALLGASMVVPLGQKRPLGSLTGSGSCLKHMCLSALPGDVKEFLNLKPLEVADCRVPD